MVTSTQTSHQDRTDRYARLIVSKYASIVTTDSTGKEVPSVVWAAPYAGRVHIWVSASSAIAARIAHSPTVEIAPCDDQGHLLADASHAHARILFPEETPTVIAAMSAKYRWRFRFVRFGAFLGRVLFIHPRGHVGIEITLQ